MAKQAKIKLKEFVDIGYLQEVNRQFFHPLGLSLEIKKTGNTFELDGLWDFREVKGGIKFGPQILETKDFIEKSNNIKNLQKNARAIRKELYGEIVQKVSAEYEGK